MATNLEIEFKNMLTETEYDRLIQTFNIQEEQIWLQKNVYFDTKSHDLKQKGAALRIRVKNNTKIRYTGNHTNIIKTKFN